jgi:calcineurin-like phosphoesterase family protein
MTLVFMTADQHFGNDAIILYENRPFTNADEMDRALIRNWNAVVGKGDTVFVLGDFALAPRLKVASIVARLHGRKILVMGNHDRRKTIHWWNGVGFFRVYDYPIIYEDFFILSHEPAYLNEAMPYANLHGHLHAKRLSLRSYVNMSVENWDYAPVDFEEVKKALAERKQ